MNKHEILRQRYAPKELQILFVAEAAPDDSERFFYNPDASSSHDWLYLGLMKALYEDAEAKPDKWLRQHKVQYLNRFMNDGNYLVDAVDEHLPKPSTMSKSQRMRMIKDNSEAKAKEIKELIEELGSEETKVILIKATVFEGLYDVFLEAGIPLEQKTSIPFPLYPQHKKEFHQKLTTLLSDLGVPRS